MPQYLKHILFAFMGLCSCNYAIAQSLETLTAQYPNDYAVILNHTEEMRIFLVNGQPQAETLVNVDILILDDKANGSYNKYKIYHGGFNEIKNLEAYTKVPDGRGFKKIKVTDLKTQNSPSEGIFYDDVKETAFDFPAVTRGSVCSVSYTESEKDGHLFSPYFFVSYMPVINQHFSVSFPSDMQLKYVIKNDETHAVSFSEDKKGKEFKYDFTAGNMQSPDYYANAPNRKYFAPHIIFQIVSYKNEQGNTVKFLGNLDDLYQWNFAFLKEVIHNKDPQLQQLADSLSNNLSNPMDKARSIYQWVQSNIKYVAFEEGLEGFVPRKPLLVCNRRFGDCKDMSCLLTTLLQMAGIDAHFTWIGTRDIPYDYTDVSLPITDNHMICAANINGQWIFLDATDPNCIFGFPSGFIQGKQALVAINETEYKALRVPEVSAEQNTIVDSTFITVASNGITGNMTVYYNGYCGIDVYNSLLYKDTKDTREYVKYRMGKASNKFIMNDYSLQYLNRDEKTVNIKADFDVPDYSKKIANELYINLNLEKFFTGSSVIDTARRKVAVENEYKYSINQYTILDVPKEYTISYLPKDFTLSNDVMDFAIRYTQQPDRVIAQQKLQYKKLLVQPGDFDKWNSSIKQILTQYKEQLVLQKQ